TAAPSLDFQSGATVGMAYYNQDLSDLQELSWTVEFPDDTAGDGNAEPATVLDPGAHGHLSLGHGDTVTLSPRTYTFESISSWNGSAIFIDNTAGAVNVYSRNGLTLQGPITRSAPEATVLFGVAGETPVWLQNDAYLNFALVAPWAQVTVHPPEEPHYGSIFAKQINADATQDYYLEPFTPLYECLTGGCSELCPCDSGEGTCESDAHCAEGLECPPN